jgi:fatty-acid desaturase
LAPSWRFFLGVGGHPTSARHGLTWYEIDFNWWGINWWGIRLLQLLRLAKRIKYVCLNALPSP